MSKYNVIMKDFPINELLSAADIERIRDSLVLIFSHFLKKLKTASYPIGRALLLVDAIGRDVYDQLVRVLSVQRLMVKNKKIKKKKRICIQMLSANRRCRTPTLFVSLHSPRIFSACGRIN